MSARKITAKVAPSSKICDSVCQILPKSALLSFKNIMFRGTPGILIPKALQFQKESHSRGKSQWTVSELVLTSESREGQEHSHRPGERSPPLRAKRPGSPVWCRQLHPHRGRRLFMASVLTENRPGGGRALGSPCPMPRGAQPDFAVPCRSSETESASAECAKCISWLSDPFSWSLRAVQTGGLRAPAQCRLPGFFQAPCPPSHSPSPLLRGQHPGQAFLFL